MTGHENEPVQISPRDLPTRYGIGNLPKPMIDRYAKDLGVNKVEVLALAPDNDPFNIGTRAHLRDAEWFVPIWEQWAGTDGFHLRRIHYRYLNNETAPIRPDGKPYTGTDNDFDELCKAAVKARYLRLVDPWAFEDHKATTERLADDPAEIEDPDADLDLLTLTDMGKIEAWRKMIGQPTTKGYDYRPGLQPVKVICVVEKSTVNDILEPLAEELDFGLVVGEGHISNTIVYEALAGYDGRPLRIIYISDLDMAGESMPIQFSRTLEFEAANLIPDEPFDIAVEHVALNEEQVAAFDLPFAPIPLRMIEGKVSAKSAELRDSWERRRGFRGRVELDALVAIRPGVLDDIVRDAVGKWRDPHLEWKWMKARLEAEKAVRKQWKEHAVDLLSDVSTMRKRSVEIRKRYNRPLRNYNAAVGRFNAKTKKLSSKLDDLVESFDPDLPPVPIPADTIEDEWKQLFRTDRLYLDQLDHYREFKNRPTINEILPRCINCGNLTRKQRAKYCGRLCSDEYRSGLEQ